MTFPRRGSARSVLGIPYRVMYPYCALFILARCRCRTRRGALRDFGHVWDLLRRHAPFQTRVYIGQIITGRRPFGSTPPKSPTPITDRAPRNRAGFTGRA